MLGGLGPLLDDNHLFVALQTSISFFSIKVYKALVSISYGMSIKFCRFDLEATFVYLLYLEWNVTLIGQCIVVHVSFLAYISINNCHYFGLCTL